MEQADGAFASERIQAKFDDFIFVKVSDMKTVKEHGVDKAPYLNVFSPDGDKISEGFPMDTEGLMKIFENAQNKYSNKDVSWDADIEDGVSKARDKEKPLVIFFADDDKEASKEIDKAFAYRGSVKYHDKFIFVKVKFDKDSEEAKKWHVSNAPTVIFANTLHDDASKSPFEKFSGKKGARDVKSLLQSVLKKFEKELEKKKKNEK